MRVVEYTSKGRLERHEVYTPAEAEERGVEYLIDWRQASEVGQWVLTDDGFVIQVLALGRRTRSGKETLAWVRTATGSFPVNGGKELDTKPRQCRWTFSGKNPSSNPHAKRRIAFARLVAHGAEIMTAYRQTHPKYKNEADARVRAFALLEQEHIKKVIVEELGEVLKKLNLDKEFVLRNMKELAQEADNDSVRLGALKQIGGYVGLDGRTSEEKSTKVFLGITHEEINQIQGSRATAEVRELPAEPEGAVVGESS